MKGVQEESTAGKDNPSSTDVSDLKSQHLRQLSIPMIAVSQSFDIQAANYQVLSDGLDEIEFEDFLSNLEIDYVELPIASLLKLFNQEMSPCSTIKWSWADHVLEKLLQWPLLSSNDLGLEAKSSYCSRVRPVERSILLKKTWGLIKAYGAKGFTNGLELGIFTPIHAFIYAMLLYRFIVTLQTGEANLEDFRSSFVGSDQKGIDSLVHLLAHLEVRWLRLILMSPLLIAVIQGLSGMWGVKPIPVEKLIQEVDQHLTRNSWLRDGFYEALPGISSSSQLSISGKLSRLETAVRWDGRLSPQERRNIFAAIDRVVQQGKKFTRLHALQGLAKIAHGVGFKDLKRLKTVGYSKEELAIVLYTKGKALEILESVSADDKTLSTLPVRIYRQYLLWWLLGLNTDVYRQQLPAFLSKAVKLAIELYFFQMIVLSILEAIRCPDKPGFELGFGYSKYANLLTIDCYLQMITQFRAINITDSAQQLVTQTQYFNLQGLNNISFWNKNLTGIDMVAILQSAEYQGAIFTELEIYDYFADMDMAALAIYLNNSHIQALFLGCSNSDVSEGGEGLTNQGFTYLISVLPFMPQLTVLWLCFANVDDTGISALAEVLKVTPITKFILVANITDTGGIQLAEALATLPMQQLLLQSPRIGDDTVYALAAMIQNSPPLTYLLLDGIFGDTVAAFLAQMIQNSSLIELGLRSPVLTDDGVIALAQVIANLPLQALEIGSQSSEDGIITLTNQLNKTNITSLELYFNAFTNRSMEMLVAVLPSTKITQLVFNYNNLNDQAVVTTLAQGILDSSVTSLVIANNNMNDSLALLSPAISQLTNCEITLCNITDDSITALTPFLIGSSLENLYLMHNQIGDDILAFVKTLPNTHIAYLDLEDNRISDNGAQALANIYEQTSLQTLYLMSNNISSNILYQVENFQWQTYCQDQLCHANTHYNSGNNLQGKQQKRKRTLPLRGFRGFEKTSKRTMSKVHIQNQFLLTSSANRLQPMFFNLLFMPYHYLIDQLRKYSLNLPFNLIQ